MTNIGPSEKHRSLDCSVAIIYKFCKKRKTFIYARPMPTSAHVNLAHNEALKV